jgi:undecaprenyl-diphosphatase
VVEAVEAAEGGAGVGARRALGFGIVLVLLVVVPLGLLIRAGWQPLLELDRSVSDELVVPGRGTDVDVLRVLTAAGLVEARFVVLLPLVIWLAFVRRWQLVVFVVVAGFSVSAMNGLLKQVFDRQRPNYEDTIDVGGLSFPSGHSAGAATLATILVVVGWPVLVGVSRRIWVALAVLGMVVVGYTRIALGAHFLSDVVAGWSFGVAWVLLLAVALQVWPGQPGAWSQRAPSVTS